MGDIQTMVELLKVLANDNRLQIVCLLLEGELTVTEIHASLPNLTQSAVSQHLSSLKAHRLLTSVKEGLQVRYTIADERLRAVITLLKEQYCNS